MQTVRKVDPLAGTGVLQTVPLQVLQVLPDWPDWLDGSHPPSLLSAGGGCLGVGVQGQVEEVEVVEVKDVS